MTDSNIVVGAEIERLFEDVGLGELLLIVLKSHAENILQIDVATGEKLFANVLLSRAIKFAKFLKSLGIGYGDAVSINSENRLEFCTIPVGTLFAGATFAPLNPDYTPLELKHVLGLSKPKVIVCSAKTIDKIIQILPDHPFVKKVVLFGDKRINHKDVLMFNDITAGEDVDDEFVATLVDPKEAVATILCSSGTTGLPKGVMCTHDNMTAYIDIARTMLKESLENDDPSDAMMGLVPFFHSFGFMLMFLNILRGKTMIVMSRFHIKAFLDSIIKYEVTRLSVPPPVLLIMLKSPLTNSYDLSCIKEIRSGAAPMGKDMERELKERFGIEHVSQGYGMTETTLAVLLSPSHKSKLGSCGVVVPGMMAKVIDENGKILPAYKEGELCFKGPLIMKGYIGDKQATSATIDNDNWLHTGDVAYYDDEGFFYIVDRLKELIKYKAFQVAPAELEALLLTHPSIADAAVIGLPDEMAGELPLAYVVKKPGKDITEKDVEKFVADNVSHQKQLRGGVIFTNSIPRNPTGKILRRVLRETAKKWKAKL